MLIPGFSERLLDELGLAIEAGPVRFRELLPLRPNLSFVKSPFSPVVCAWVGASLVSTVNALYRDSELQRASFMEKGQNFPDWTCLLDPDRRKTLFSTSNGDTSLISF